jgi:zinc protease
MRTSNIAPGQAPTRIPGRSVLKLILGIMLATNLMTLAADAAPRASAFTLANGMEVVVIPDHRAPVITHMVWYRVGSSDEPKGSSGIAHFLEHLMFKSTDKIPMGEFSKIVSRLGGQDNAFTGNDATAYFQRVAKEQLGKVMDMEADRMVNLRLTEKEVLTERDVILEERRSRIENNPMALLDEEMDASLYLNHPYHIPVIGWMHEMAKLSPDDAMRFYKHWYAPNNAILVVSGDVTAEEVRTLAEGTYGKIPANPQITGKRERPAEPPHRAPRRVDLMDARAGNTSISRYYYAPCYVTAAKGDAEALDVLVRILGNGATSRLYKKLVVEEKIASTTTGWYQASGLDSGKISLSTVVADGADPAKVEAAMDRVLEEVKRNGVTDAELVRAKNGLVADYVYESDSQATLARRYGWGLVVGRSIEAIESWPQAIAQVTAADVKKVANTYLDLRQAVTGTLSPDSQATTVARSGAGAAPIAASEMGVR